MNDVGGRRTSGAVEVAEVECVRVVCLPRGEEHGQHGDQGSKGANLGGAVADSSRLEQACQGAVQGVDAVTAVMSVRKWAQWGIGHILEELAQRTRCASAAGLLSVDVVHGRVHPHAKGEAVVYP